MPLSTFLGVADSPGRLDGYGPVPAGLARRIAADAAKEQPTFTAWRCIVTDDIHGSVLGVTDPIWTPRHDPPPRLTRLVEAMEPVCVFPGCRHPARPPRGPRRAGGWDRGGVSPGGPPPPRRCALAHRTPSPPHAPAGQRGGENGGGRTCSCELQPLCRAHHQQKTAGALRVRAIGRAEDPTAPAGTLEWTLPSGVTCRSHPHIAAPPPTPTPRPPPPPPAAPPPPHP